MPKKTIFKHNDWECIDVSYRKKMKSVILSVYDERSFANLRMRKGHLRELAAELEYWAEYLEEQEGENVR